MDEFGFRFTLFFRRQLFIAHRPQTMLLLFKTRPIALVDIDGSNNAFFRLSASFLFKDSNTTSILDT